CAARITSALAVAGSFDYW
nr:immunoglobulin heavy chain junction region [Macaca mulatta]